MNGDIDMVKNEIEKIKSEISQLKQITDFHEQHKLEKNLKIIGLPKHENKTDLDIVHDIFQKLQLDIDKLQILHMYRAFHDER